MARAKPLGATTLGGRSSSKKPKSSLTALAQSLDTRKRPLPSGGASRDANKSQRALIENALRAKPAAPVKVQAPPPRAVVPAKVQAPPPRAVVPAKVQALPPRAVVPAKVQTPPPRAVVPVAKVVAPPARPVTASPASLSRATALTSLQRSPGPVPSRLPVAKPAAVPTGDPRRQYPRAEIQVRARLSIADDPKRFFEASLPTVNLSVGGMFLESSFFLKIGTQLTIELQLPAKGRAVKVKGEVVRVESTAQGQSGFAVRFTEYFEGSQITLATHFLSPVLKEFLSQYAKEHRFDASPEYLTHTADVLAAWELKKAELGGDVWNLFPAKS